MLSHHYAYHPQYYLQDHRATIFDQDFKHGASGSSERLLWNAGLNSPCQHHRNWHKTQYRDYSIHVSHRRFNLETTHCEKENKTLCNMLFWRNFQYWFFKQLFYLYFDFCTALRCVSGLMKMSIKLMDNVLQVHF